MNIILITSRVKIEVHITWFVGQATVQATVQAVTRIPDRAVIKNQTQSSLMLLIQKQCLHQIQKIPHSEVLPPK